MRVNRHFTKKKVLKMNLKDVLIVEQLENNNKEEIEAAAVETAAAEIEALVAAEIGGKLKGEFNSPFFIGR